METTTKRLTYKVARFLDESKGYVLQDLIATALFRRRGALSRRQETDEEGTFRLINYHAQHYKMRVGDLFDYTSGHRQPYATFEKEAETLKVSSVAPPGKQSEFLHSILYFSSWGNHLLMAQSTSLKSKQLEEYLNWLFQESGVLAKQEFVALCDHPPLEKESEIMKTKAIELFAPVSFKPSDDDEKKSVTFTPKGLAWEAIKHMLPAGILLPENVGIEDIVANKTLEVKLSMKWRQSRDADPSDLLDQIANQLRHVDDEIDYAIDTKSGGKITKEDFKIARPVTVKVNREGIPLREDMWEKMNTLYSALITEGRIEADA